MAQQDRTEIFENMPVAKAVRTMALPAICGQIIVLIYNMADTFFLGQTNNPDMVAGASLILPVFNICLALANLSGIGGGSLISRLLGQKNEEEAKKVSAFCFYLAIGITLLFSVSILLFMDRFLGLLGANEATLGYARSYTLCVVVLGGIPTVLSNVLANFLRSVGVSREAGFGITMGGIINIGLDPLFMFVLLPKGKEVLGVGLATLLSNCIVCGFFLCVILLRRKQLPLSFRLRKGLPGRQSIRSVFFVGAPSAITTLLFDIDYMVLNKLMTGYTTVTYTVPLAAIGIVLKAERLPLNVGIGICQGMLPIVAYNFAARNKERMNAVIRFSLKLGLIISAISIVLYEFSARYIMRFFIADAATVALGTKFLMARCLATPLMFISFFTVNVFQGFGKGGRALFLGVTRWLVFNIPMLFLLNYLVGMYGLVWAQVTADTLTVILSFCVYRQYTKREALFVSGGGPG